MDPREPRSSRSTRPPFAQRAAAWAGIVGVPAIWTVHLLASTILVATACAGGVAQRNALPWSLVETMLRVASAVALIVALACSALAWRAWRRAAHAVGVPAQSDAAVTSATSEHGKHRFVALCGAMAAAGFTIGLLFTASVLIAASPSQLCEPFR